MEKLDLVTVRDYCEADQGFVYKTWLRGLYYSNDWVKEIPTCIYYGYYPNVINFVLSSPKTQVKLAVLKEDLDVILGYAVFEEEKLHWVFVKPPWRKLGIAKMLVPENITTVTHLTFIGRAIKQKKKLVFNPF
jgi:GNAT superfamily N-acetyltransferase